MIETPKKLISVSGTITVQKNLTDTFRYLSDLRLDKNWRTEINETHLSEPELKPGAIATEDSFLSKRVPNYKAALKCTELLPDKAVIYESLPENPYWLKSSRQVEALSGNATRITYQLAFDIGVVKHGLGFQLPAFLLKYYTTLTLNKYLRNLKQILEQTPAGS